MMTKEFDRRWIFLSIGLLVLIFLRVPLKLKYKSSPQTLGFFQAVESLPAGSTFFLSIDYGPGTEAELRPMHEALVYHLMKRNVKIIGAAIMDTGPPIADMVFKKVTADLGQEGIRKEYGKDYVNLGYKSGLDVAIAKIGASIVETYPTDNFGKTLENLPMMKDVKNFSQIVMLCSISSGSPGVRQWLQQVQSRYKVRMITGVTAVMTPDLYSFMQTGQLEGFLGGLVGAAEYENLLGRPGSGMGGMGVQSLAHMLILGFIVIGNVLYIRSIIKEKRSRARV